MLLVFSLFAVMPARSQHVVHPYDWVQIGAYAKYFAIHPPAGIVLPNGTRKNLAELYSPLLFEWTIVDKQGSKVRLNVTLFIYGWSYDIDFKRVNITYHKNLFIDVDIYTRESFIDDEPIGKTCFWADPYKEVGDNVTVFTDPDLLEANVWWVRTVNWDYIEQEFKMYGADLRTEDPSAYAYGSYVFSWYTGVAIEPTFLGPPWEVPPGEIGNLHTGVFENGTEYNVTRYAGTKLGTYLGLAILTDFGVDLNETNIDLTLETEPEPPSEPLNLWQYLPYAFLATFATTATAFVILRRRKQSDKQKETKKS
jgi:hypothetical protein